MITSKHYTSAAFTVFRLKLYQIFQIFLSWGSVAPLWAGLAMPVNLAVMPSWLSFWQLKLQAWNYTVWSVVGMLFLETLLAIFSSSWLLFLLLCCSSSLSSLLTFSEFQLIILDLEVVWKKDDVMMDCIRCFQTCFLFSYDAIFTWFWTYKAESNLSPQWSRPTYWPFTAWQVSLYQIIRYHFHSFEWPKKIILILPAAIFSFAPVLLCWPISIVPIVPLKIHCKSPWTICFSIYSVSGCQPGSAVSDIHKNSHLHH